MVMNSQPTDKFQTFEDLDVYKAAREFRKGMYAVTRKLPDFERFELASQIRRAAVSLTNNISEGHGRYHYLDQIRFLLQARGSLEELRDDLNICEDENYLSLTELAQLREQARTVSKLVGGYVRFLRRQKSGEKLLVRETAPDYLTDVESAPV
jgi:four helix bundle protein